MPLFSFQEGLILFIHVPKTGGSSVSWTLNEVAKRALWNLRKSEIIPCTPQHFHAAILDTLVPNDYPIWSFVIVRHPIVRLLSEYRWRSDNYARQGKSIEPFDAWVSQTFEQYLLNSYVFDNHIRPQCEFILERVEIFKFEDGLSKVYEALQKHVSNQVLGSDTRDIRRNKSTKSHISMTRGTYESILEFYRDDFDSFSYPIGIEAIDNVTLHSPKL